MAKEPKVWPPFVELVIGDGSAFKFDYWSPDCEAVSLTFDNPSDHYIHRDAARAWQAFRDWLNGTPNEWLQIATVIGDQKRLDPELAAIAESNLWELYAR